jgi:cardiolipin synthase
VIRLIGAGTRRDREPVVRDTFWTVPNILTVVRFLGVPLFVWFIARENFGSALVTLAILGSTDWVDGYLARRLDQVSTVGRWLDPLADRTAIVVVAVTFVVAGIAPSWLVYAIVVPDAVLLLTVLALFRGPVDLPVSLIGKVRTALLLAGSPLLLLYRVPGFGHPWILHAAYVILFVGCLGHVIAFSGYFRAVWRRYRAGQPRRDPANDR